MPIIKIEVDEYQCLLCGHRWINRVNSKDGSIPERCAKCKRYGWNGGESSNRNPITPQESGLRRRIKGLPGLYYYKYEDLYDPTSKLGRKYAKIEDVWDLPLTAMFLMLDNPRPTIEELGRVLCPPGLVVKLDSQNQRRGGIWIPNPDKPGWMKYSHKDYQKYLDSDKKKIHQAMEEIVIKREGADWRKKALQIQKKAAAKREAKRKEGEEKAAALEATREARTAEILGGLCDVVPIASPIPK